MSKVWKSSTTTTNCKNDVRRLLQHQTQTACGMWPGETNSSSKLNGFLPWERTSARLWRLNHSPGVVSGPELKFSSNPRWKYSRHRLNKADLLAVRNVLLELEPSGSSHRFRYVERIHFYFFLSWGGTDGCSRTKSNSFDILGNTLISFSLRAGGRSKSIPL